MKRIKFELDDPRIKTEMPRRSTKNSAGYDFIANESFYIPANGDITIDTNLKVFMPSDVFLGMFPRSGLGFKFGIGLANTVGVIDSDYYSKESGKGVIKVKLVNPSNVDVFIEKGKAYAQGIFMHYDVVDDDDASGDRNGDGFGSTDNK